MLSKDEANTLRKSILEDNKLLYRMHKRPMEETCMCWGLEVPDAWLNVVDDMSLTLEGINALAYPASRVCIQMDQVKSKYGTLHAYYSIVADPPSWIMSYEKYIGMLISLVSKVDFKLKAVVDHEAYDEVVCKEIPADKYEEELKLSKYASNVEVFTDKSGKHVRKTTLHHCKKIHYEPTRCKFLHWILTNKHMLVGFARRMCRWQPSHKQECICNYIASIAENVVRKATSGCMDYCERCGAYMASNQYATRGWISYICEECAKKDGNAFKLKKDNESLKRNMCEG